MNSENRWSKRACIFALVPVLLFLLTGCGSTRPGEPGEAEGPGTTEETHLPATAEPVPEQDASGPVGEEPAAQEGANRMFYANVNGSVLSIIAAENSSADAFLDLLKAGDLTIEMRDYGSFEKVGPLGTTLPRNDEQITTEPGDVILYQGDQITIYYDVNSWNFTRLGKVQDLSPAELKAILGAGNAAVTFSLNQETDAGGTA